MFRNYYKVGIRNILKYKAFSTINVLGLAMSMSLGMLIILMISDANSYDKFHENGDRVYRMIMKREGHSNPYATVPFPLAQTLKTDYPIVEDATAIRRGVGGDITFEDQYTQARGYFADEAFFHVLGFDLSSGNKNTALKNPNSIVISQDIAFELFGNEDPVGQSINFIDRKLNFFDNEASAPVDWGQYEVTGVISNNDYKSHLEFDVLISSESLELLYKENKIGDLTSSWKDHFQTYSYAMLTEEANQEDLDRELIQTSSIQFTEEGFQGSLLYAQPLSEITPGTPLGNEPTIRLPTIAYYALSLLALLVILSACFNYTNLSIARAFIRSKEIGVRKVNGANRATLILQFLSESIIISFLSLLLAQILLLFIRSAFKGLWVNQHLNFDLNISLMVYSSFILFALLVGLLAGFFPALSLASYQPIQALKKDYGPRLSYFGLRKVLTVSQFVISLFFIISSIVIYNQFQHFMDYNYGFDTENVVNLNLQSNDYVTTKQILKETPGVQNIAGCAYLPATGRNDNTSLEIPDQDEKVNVIDLGIDEDFIDVMGIDLIAGENIQSSQTGQSTILINERAVKALGYKNASDIVNEFFLIDGENIVSVSGVVEDFTFQLLFNGRETGPIVMRSNPDRIKFLTLKIQEDDKHNTIGYLEEKWKLIDQVHPLDYEFYDEKLSANNQGIFDLVSVIGFTTFLAIIISCLGLLGMAIYSTERRTKEVSIRRILGANDLNLLVVLSKEFMIVIGISILIAAPLSYFVNNFWLEFLIVRIDFGWKIIATGCLVILLIASATIFPQVLKISNTNPSNTLKSE